MMNSTPLKYGLLTIGGDGGAILEAVDNKVQVYGFTAHVTSELTYMTSEGKPKHFVFLIPKCDEMVFFKLKVHIGNDMKTVSLNSIQSEGGVGGSSTGSNNQSSYIQIKLGILTSNKCIKICVEYILELVIDAMTGSAHFTLPEFVVPEYHPQNLHQHPYRLQTSVVVYSSQEIAYISSSAQKTLFPCFKIMLSKDRKTGHIVNHMRLPQEKHWEGHWDLSIKYKDFAKKPHHFFLEKGSDKDSDDMVMLNLFINPAEMKAISNLEIILVLLECNNSEINTQMNRSANFWLRSLKMGQYFNIVKVRSQDVLRVMNPQGCVPYDQGNFEQAIQFISVSLGVEEFEPSMDLFATIHYIMWNFGKPQLDHERQILVVNGGGVPLTRMQEANTLIASNNYPCRLFALGMVEEEEEPPIKALTEMFGGAFEPCCKTDDIVPAMGRIAQKMMKIQFRVECEYKEVVNPPKDFLILDEVGENIPSFELIPKVLHTNTSGRPLIQYIRIPKKSQISKISVKCMKDIMVIVGESIITINPSILQESKPIHKLAVMVIIKELESEDVKKRSRDAVIMNLSKANNVPSIHTALQMVDQRGVVVKVSGDEEDDKKDCYHHQSLINMFPHSQEFLDLIISQQCHNGSWPNPTRMCSLLGISRDKLSTLVTQKIGVKSELVRIATFPKEFGLMTHLPKSGFYYSQEGGVKCAFCDSNTLSHRQWCSINNPYVKPEKRYNVNSSPKLDDVALFTAFAISLLHTMFLEERQTWDLLAEKAFDFIGDDRLSLVNHVRDLIKNE